MPCHDIAAALRTPPTSAMATIGQTRREQSRQPDATRHPKGETSHHETGPDVETADPAQSTRHGTATATTTENRKPDAPNS